MQRTPLDQRPSPHSGDSRVAPGADELSGTAPGKAWRLIEIMIRAGLLTGWGPGVADTSLGLAPAVALMQPVRDPLERLARQGCRFPAHPARVHPDHPV